MSTNYQPIPAPPANPNSGLKTALLAGAIIALLGTNVYLYLQLEGVKTDSAKFKETVLSELVNLRESSTATTAASRKHLEDLKADLNQARIQANTAATQAKKEALSRVDQVQAKLSEEQQKQAQALNSEISQVKQAASTANEKIGDVSGQVSSVKSEVAATKSELEKTINDLKRVTGDLGVQSGLIATNGKELAALKRLGERNYFEFKLAKAKQPQRVGDVTMLLKKADPKKNRYTIELVADDKRVTKDNKTINEPVQFFTSKAKQPYEIVVNEVSKDLIVGYLATPKEQIARN